MKFKLMAVEVAKRKSKGSCIDTASQLMYRLHALIGASAQAS